MSVIVALPVIEQICKELKYTRAHVVNILRENSRTLGAKRHNRNWLIPRKSVDRFRRLVRETSGLRYKLGEKGPQR
jgi:hypothetical protein